MEILLPIFGSCVFLGAFAVFGLVVAGIVYAIVRGRKVREAHVRALRDLAAEMGYTFHEQDPWGLQDRYRDAFDLFRCGDDRKASDILSGSEDGRAVLLFQYEYETSSGTGKDRTTTTWHHQVALVELPIEAPHLELRGENFLDRIAAWVGHDDLDFESDEFSRRYHVRCDQPRFAYDIFHTRLMEHLLETDCTASIEMRGPLMLVVESGAGDIPRLLRLKALALRLVASIPPYVLSEHGRE